MIDLVRYTEDVLKLVHIHRRRKSIDCKARVNQMGYTYVGDGAYSIVIANPTDDKQVIKISCKENDGAIAFLKWIVRNKVVSEVVPVVHYFNKVLTPYADYYVVVMDRYEEVDRKREHLIELDCGISFMQFKNKLQNRVYSLFDDVHFKPKEKVYREYIDILRRFLVDVKVDRNSVDISRSNLLLDTRNNMPVMVDVFSRIENDGD